jgi:hypothetical protein
LAVRLKQRTGVFHTLDNDCPEWISGAAMTNHLKDEAIPLRAGHADSSHEDPYNQKSYQEKAFKHSALLYFENESKYLSVEDYLNKRFVLARPQNSCKLSPVKHTQDFIVSQHL